MSNYTKDNHIEKRLIQEILTPSDYEKNLGEIIKIIRQEFSIDFCLIISDFDNLTSFYITKEFPENISKIPQKNISELIEKPWIQTIKNESKIKCISNLQQNKNQISLPFLEKNYIQSLLGIGTNFKGKVNGIILLGKIESHQWTQSDKKRLKEVANVVAIACKLNQLQGKNDGKLPNKDTPFSLTNIPKLLEENPILRLWWETTRKQLERQLEWNKKLIYNMITIMSDQTRNPLAILKMGITILRTKKLSSEELEKRLGMLEEACHNLNEINDKILQLKSLKSQNLTLNVTSVNFKNFINEITANYQTQWQKDDKNTLNLAIDFEVDSEEKISTDTEHLKNIIEELLTNASKFSVMNSTVNLKITQENNSNQSQIIMTFSNISNCMSPENITDFFEPFYREQIVIDTAIPGIGVGLNIVKDLVELLQGKITVESLPTDLPKHCKIVFRLVIPQFLSS
ncbi:MAG: GAF domain-containing sensor histidine kinase [Crocosphaera sp.]